MGLLEGCLSFGGTSRLRRMLGKFLWIVPLWSATKLRWASEVISIIRGRDKGDFSLWIQNADLIFREGIKCAMHSSRSLAVLTGSLNGEVNPETNRFFDLSFVLEREVEAFWIALEYSAVFTKCSRCFRGGNEDLIPASSLSICRIILTRISFWSVSCVPSFLMLEFNVSKLGRFGSVGLGGSMFSVEVVAEFSEVWVASD